MLLYYWYFIGVTYITGLRNIEGGISQCLV